MDSMFPTGQNNTLAEYMILSGADNRPPMLDKDLYDSWKIRMELYMQNKEHGRMILESVEHSPLIWPTIEENGVTRTKKYVELSPAEKIQADCDMKAIKIILQGQLISIHFKFVTDFKLVKDFHTTNFDQLYAYLEQHELHANEVRLMCERNQDPLVLVAIHQMTPPHFHTYQSSHNNPQFQQQFSPSQSHQYGSTHPTQHYSTTYPSTPHAITYPPASYPNAYSSTVHQETYPQPQSVPQIEYTISTVNQQTHLAEFPQMDSGLALRNSSNPRQQATIHDGRVTVQPLQGRQNSYADGTSGTRANTSGTGRNYSGSQKVVKCFNYQEEFHMARQCPKPKRKRDATWFREKVILVEAQGNGKVLIEEELEFLADSGIAEGPISIAKAVLMANLSSYESDVLSEVPIFDNTNNDMLNQSVQEMPYFDPSQFVEHSKNEIHSDSNIISYSQYLIESQNAAVQDTNSSTQQDAMILSVFEQLSEQVTNCNKVNKDNLMANESLSAELERYKEQIKLLEERQNMDLSTREKLIIDDFEKEINSLKQTLSSN
ncbi:retrovirus-related pol polyprotein from transposon TNT 1-94 [Tanacetum coccineum]